MNDRDKQEADFMEATTGVRYPRKAKAKAEPGPETIPFEDKPVSRADALRAVYNAAVSGLESHRLAVEAAQQLRSADEALEQLVTKYVRAGVLESGNTYLCGDKALSIINEHGVVRVFLLDLKQPGNPDQRA